MEDLRKELAARMEMLKKNKEAISINGRIPAQYAKAYKKKLGEMYTLLDEYVFRVVTGDWWLGDTIQERQVFIDAYTALVSSNGEGIALAIKQLNMENLDNALVPLNKSFERDMIDCHVEAMKRKCRQFMAAQ